VVGIPIRKDNDIAGPQLGALSIGQLDDGPAFDDQMVEHKVLRPWSDLSRHQIRRRCRKSPGSREFGSEEHRAQEFDSAQDLGEHIHTVRRTVCKVSWVMSKGISLPKPFEQVMATLGHGYSSRRIAQL